MSNEGIAFHKGEKILLKDASVGIMTHAMHYGTAVFEGIRGNWNNDKKDMVIFRLDEHYERLLRGAKILRMNLPYSVKELSEITVDLVKDVLKDLLRTNSRKITIDEIQKKVVEHYNIKLSDMHSPRRSRSVARPRQVAMYLAKSITTRSLPEIGRKFGGRDHTTVIHAIKTIEEIMVNDPSLAEDIELLTRILQTS